MAAKIIYFGNEQLAQGIKPKTPIFDALVEADYDICALILPNAHTRQPFAIAKRAEKLGIPIYYTKNNAEINEIIAKFQPEIGVLSAFGKIIKDETIAAFPRGILNIHPSLLPKYRGTTPIESALLNNDKETGVSVMRLAHDMDAGDIIYTAETEIGEFETAGELFDRLMDMGAELLVKTLRDIEAGTAPRTPQDHSRATYVKMLDKSICPIDWNKSPREIVKHIYGLQPWPVATMELEYKSFRVFGAEYTDMKTDKAPGAVVKADDALVIACADGQCLAITELQAPGKKRMRAADFLRGHKIALS